MAFATQDQVALAREGCLPNARLRYLTKAAADGSRCREIGDAGGKAGLEKGEL